MTLKTKPSARLLAIQAASVERDRREREDMLSEDLSPGPPRSHGPILSSLARPDRSGRGSSLPNSLTAAGLTALIVARRAVKAVS